MQNDPAKTWVYIYVKVYCTILAITRTALGPASLTLESVCLIVVFNLGQASPSYPKLIIGPPSESTGFSYHL